MIYIKIYIDIDSSIEYQLQDYEERYGGWELLQYFRNPKVAQLAKQESGVFINLTVLTQFDNTDQKP